jgi:hypothetical protein
MSFGGKRSAKPKAYKAPPKLLEQLCFFHDGAEKFWVLQLPMVLHAQTGYADAARFVQKRAARQQLDVVLLALQTQLRGIDRERIDQITLVRFSPGKLDAHDNLRQAFKHVLDATCVWICVGSGDFNRRAIGKYDDQLLGTGRVTCHYEQTTHESDRRLQGIHIRLRLRSPQESAREE